MASARVPLKRLMPLWQTLNFMVASDICVLYFYIDRGKKNLRAARGIAMRGRGKFVTALKY
jgi:hypothetical protein